MRVLVFVTPAHGRYALTDICLAQRRHVCDELARCGVEATCVVVACDNNLDAAERHGFVALERPNVELGRRFNDGIEHACRALGAEFVVPVGSDDWLLTDYLLPLPSADEVRSGGALTLMAPDGSELACVTLGEQFNADGYIPWVIPAALLRRCAYRPIADSLDYGIDASLANGIVGRGPRPFRFRHTHDMQLVDFKSWREQLTSYRRTVELNPLKWADRDPFGRLVEVYPAELVERVRALYR